ncbi:N-acetylmuramoyl-L-alanine amidase [Rhizohabitans arisaemae]|uniref:N-acetylmuramoyl-L-alanine amidase n=1 Tax=Rhizohabitans arisaemae TaxID=2720610 RepID=UPI0024B1EBEF|nr:N-acetylmuramoyl-L-alanine amidase [Rhizohabitans arisaemae]
MSRKALTSGGGRPAAVLALCLSMALGTACGTAGTEGHAAQRPQDAVRPEAARTAPESRTPGTLPGSPPARGSLAGKRIVLDPGHNGNNYRHPEIINRKVNVITERKACDTTGTQAPGGYTEAAFTWDVSRRLAEILRRQGATVTLTRTSNTGVGPCITERAAIGNKAKADAVLSIHADGSAPRNQGFHVIVPKKINGPVDPVVAASARLGVDIRNAYAKGTGIPYSTYVGSEGIHARNDIGGLNLSTVPKVLLECGNMKNPKEAAKFADPKFRERIAVSLSRGLNTYLR